jgi:hypothetical protein
MDKAEKRLSSFGVRRIDGERSQESSRPARGENDESESESEYSETR